MNSKACSELARALLPVRLMVFFSMCALALTACNSTSPTQTDATLTGSDTAVRFGVLVMAHGGSEQWNAQVRQTVAPVARKYPVEIAFGMADATTIQAAVSRLEAQGVNAIGVVRLFISGESWFERTAQILGLAAGAPMKPASTEVAPHTHGTAAAETAMNHSAMAYWKIDSQASFDMSIEGLSEAEEMDAVLQTRMQTLSNKPGHEDVVVIAHGPADDAENSRWIATIQQRLQQAEQHSRFHDISVFTLREDWEEKREHAEEQIRDYIAASKAQGRDVIVIPYRIQGFGPYADVLQGLDYRADGQGLIPHKNVTLWIENQAQILRRKLTGSSLQASD